MIIDFGMVDKYVFERGFGFVTRTFASDQHARVFFHIKCVKKTDPVLAAKLAQSDNSENLWFWYEVEETSKGKQVKSVVDPTTISEKYACTLPVLVDKIEQRWKNVDVMIPGRLNQVSTVLLGSGRTDELIAEREMLQLERKEENERKSREAKEQAELEAAEWKEMLQMHRAQEAEFQQLVAEIAPLGFTRSNQVSAYIMEKRLGHKYKNISGIVTMEMDGTTWNYRGGFPPNIYAKLCSALHLGNQGSSAQVIGFTSFYDMGR